MNFVALAIIGGVFSALIPSPSHAATKLTLICNIKTRFDSNGLPQRTLDINTRVEVMEDLSRGYLSIIPDSDDLPSVSTRAGAGREISNYSTPEKWHLSNKIHRERGDVSSNEFIIDRFAGTISFNGRFTSGSGGSYDRVGFGPCTKAGQEKKF